MDNKTCSKPPTSDILGTNQWTPFHLSKHPKFQIDGQVFVRSYPHEFFDFFHELDAKLSMGWLGWHLFSDPVWSVWFAVSIIFHHFPSLSIIFHHFPSFSIIFHHFPSLSITFHHFPSFSIIFNSYVSLPEGNYHDSYRIIVSWSLKGIAMGFSALVGLYPQPWIPAVSSQLPWQVTKISSKKLVVSSNYHLSRDDNVSLVVSYHQ